MTLSKMLVIILILFLPVSLFADNHYNGFDLQQSKNHLNYVEQQLLPQKKIKYLNLLMEKKSIDLALNQAKACIEHSSDTIKTTQALLQNTSIKHDPVHYNYLVKIKSKSDQEHAECSLYVLMAQQTLNVITTKLNQKDKNTLFEKTSTQELKPSNFFQFNFNSKIFFQSAHVFMPLIIHALLIYLCTIIIAKYLIISRTKSINLPLINQLSTLTSQLFISFSLTVILYTHAHYLLTQQNTPSNPNLWLAIAYFIIAIRLYVVFLKNDYISSELYRRIKIITSIYLIGYIGTLVLIGQSIPLEIAMFIQIGAIMLFNLSLLWIIWLIFYLNFFEKKISAHARKIIKVIMVVTYCFVMVLAWRGYIHLSQVFILNLISTLMLLIIVKESIYYLDHLFFLMFQNSSGNLSKKIQRFFGFDSHKKVIELILLKGVVFYIPILIFLLFILAKIWGASQFNLDINIAQIQNGINAFGIPLSGRVLYGVAVFCVIVLSGRALARYLSESNQFKNDLGRKEAVHRLVMYFMFVIALLFALIRIGFDFSKITIIAGALSVGLGFGLKDLVSDLISGIILLLTKPVKVGDHVMIDNKVNSTEGFIKEIGLFSSQLVTLSESVAIFPNSLLRNNQINNYTFKERSSRIRIHIILNNEEDLDLAKQLLIIAASTNKHIIQIQPHQPKVLFDKMLDQGSLSLMLDLVCFIKDIDLKDLVLSDLNLEIIRLFKENNLSIRLAD